MSVESTISNLIEQQFPEFYHTEGPVFVAFVEKYFEWMEATRSVANATYAEAKQNCKINVIAGNTTILATTNNATFTNCLSNGEQFAIYTKTDGSDYDLYTVNTVISDTELTLTTAPDFSIQNTRFSILTSQKNPYRFLRDFYNDIDVDNTSEEFLVYFKEKYLKDIELDTEVDIRRVIKHALDIYRSKGTERGTELLFKAVFGVSPRFYYPGDDLFRCSDGYWFIPRYLEVALKDTNVELIGKQVFGYTSGATAFVESVVRKTVKGRLIDVLYISAINGEFDTGELINSADYVLEKAERPTIIGSLTSIEITDPGSGYAVGDVFDVSSESGESAQARVANISNITGLVDITLTNGGYAYSANAEVLIANSMLVIEDVIVPNTFFPGFVNTYFKLFDDVTQPLANVLYANTTGLFTNGELVYTYHANNDLMGTGRVLIAAGNTTNGYLVLSILSGDLDDTRLYTTSNTVNSDISSYTDITAVANVFCLGDRVALSLNSISGTFTEGEVIYQVNPTSNLVVAEGKYFSFAAGVGANGTLTANDYYGVFRQGWTVTGNTSGATGTVDLQEITLGVKDILNEFHTQSNNYFYIDDGTVNGAVRSISSGTGASLAVSTLHHTETLEFNSDFIIDYYNYPLTHTALTGTVAINSTSNVVIGTGTSFDTEVEYTITGNASVNTTANVIVGSATSVFTTEIQAGDIISISGVQDVRVRKVVNNSYLYVNSAATVANTDATLTKNRWLIFTDGVTTEAHQVLSVSNATHLELDTTPSFTNTGVTVTYSWAFPGNTAANTTYGILQDIFTNANVEIGRIERINGINPGNNYTAAPCIKIYEPFTYGRYEKDFEYTLTGATGNFETSEIVDQTGTGARGWVLEGNTTYLHMNRLRMLDANDFVITDGASNTISGNSSGVTANITAINTYSNSAILGFNADITTSVITGNGAVATVQITDSGFGFRHGEEVTLDLVDNGQITGTAVLGDGIGFGPGFYKRKGGFLSDQTKILDAYYYQDFSYEIRSSIPLPRYEDMLKQLIHVAGTKYFGAFVYDSLGNAEITIPESNTIQAAYSYLDYLLNVSTEDIFYLDFANSYWKADPGSPTGFDGVVKVRDSSNNLNNTHTSPVLEASDFLTYTSPAERGKMTMGSDGYLKYQAQNLITYSADATQFVNQNSSDEQTADPDGGTDAFNVIAVGSSLYPRVHLGSVTTVSGQAYKISCQMKAGSEPCGAISWSQGSGSVWASAVYVLSGAGSVLDTDAKGGMTIQSTSITSLGDGWYQCELVATGAFTTGYAYLSFYDEAVGPVAAWNYSPAQDAAPSGGEYISYYKPQVAPYPCDDTYLKTDGAIRYALPIEYDATTGAPIGLRVEEARTNLIDDADVLGSNWSGWNITSTASQTDPAGTSLASLIAADGTLNQHYVTHLSGLWDATNQYTFSIYAKAGTANYLHLLITGDNTYVQWDLADGSVVNSSSGTGSLDGSNATQIGDWWRFEFTCTMTNTNQNVRIYPLNAAAATAGPSEASTASVILWNAQLEQGTTAASSPIQTYGSSLSRAKDQIEETTVTPEMFTNIFERTIYADVESLENSIATFVALETAGGGNRMEIRRNAGNIEQVSNFGVNPAAISATTPVGAALTHDTGTVSLAVGGTITTATGSVTAITPDRVSIGGYNAGSQAMGVIKKVIVLPRMLTDQQLEDLTK